MYNPHINFFWHDFSLQNTYWSNKAEDGLSYVYFHDQIPNYCIKLIDILLEFDKLNIFIIITFAIALKYKLLVGIDLSTIVSTGII